MRLIDNLQKGTGLYTLKEAAAFARMPAPTLNTWIFGTQGHKPLRKAQVDCDDGRYLTFVELAEAIAIRSLRHDVSLAKIRQAIGVAKEQYGVEYPFANRHHRTFRIGPDLHIILKDENDPIQISGKNLGQQGMVACLQPYMEDFEWDANDNLRSYVAFRYQRDEIVIRMNPAICSGAPIVGNTGHTAETLWREAKATGNMDEAANNYCVPNAAVAAACKYCEEIDLAA